ncbi:50S ribosomal protein L11 [Candidatus Micrarchaeota archaeon CG06_land_8_20_14_3_00_50_6]|nr:MAG: 50S ribosomal protein L11 [Candidatus Micrarchaeota archaeon CG06_land_8_20_14_3_00_50_6]
MDEKEVKAIIEGGRATPAPPLGPALAPMGVNIGLVIAEINKQTAAFAGVKVRIVVLVNPKTKAFRIEVGSPPTGELIKKEIGIEHGRKEKETAGDIKLQQVLKVAKMKSTLAKNLKALANEILGQCVSMGITCEGRDARDIIKEIKSGKHDALFSS